MSVLDKKNKKVSGFTLFELLVVIAIIGIIAVLVVVNYRQGGKKYALDSLAQKLVADIRQAQSMAISGVGTGLGGYGVRIEDFNTYVVFSDASDGAGCPTGSSESIKKTIDLSDNISFFAGVSSEIFFRPPDPKTCINAGSPNPFSVTLKNDQGQTKIVTADKYGKIEIQ